MASFFHTDNLVLNLVCITNRLTGKKQYFGVNDKHYDAMLAVEIEGYSWEWLGDVIIEEDILEEMNYIKQIGYDQYDS